MTERQTLLEEEYRRKKAEYPFYCYRMPEWELNRPVVPVHWHNEMEIFYSEACGSLYIDKTEYDVVPGDIFFINPGLIHRTFRKSHGLMSHIVFSLGILKTMSGGNEVNKRIDAMLEQKIQIKAKAEQGSEWYNELLPVISGILKYQEKIIEIGHESCMVTAYLFAMFASCYKADCFHYADENYLYGVQYVTRIMEYIGEHYREPLNVSTLAKYLSISETYLFRLFRDYVDCTPINYINSVRLREAYRLLEEGMDVTGTAAAVGIQNVSYFIKLFKSTTGQTPLGWIKEKKERT